MLAWIKSTRPQRVTTSFINDKHMPHADKFYNSKCPSICPTAMLEGNVNFRLSFKIFFEQISLKHEHIFKSVCRVCSMRHLTFLGEIQSQLLIMINFWKLNRRFYFVFKSYLRVTIMLVNRAKTRTIKCVCVPNLA